MVITYDLARFYHFDATSFLVGGNRIAVAYQKALQSNFTCPEPTATTTSTTQPPPSTTTLPPERMVLVCGSSSECSEPTQEAALYETHELRCCSDEVGPLEGWKQRSNCPHTISKINGACQHGVNYEEAIGLCDSIGGRLCTADELLRDCTKRTGL